MNSPAAIRSTFLAAMLLASTAWAGDLVKCTDAEGRVTLTDQPCSRGEAESRLPSQLAQAAAPETVAAPIQQIRQVAALPPRRLAPAALQRPVPPSRFLSHDVAMLKAARIAMHIMDSTPRMREQLANR